MKMTKVQPTKEGAQFACVYKYDGKIWGHTLKIVNGDVQYLRNNNWKYGFTLDNGQELIGYTEFDEAEEEPNLIEFDLKRALVGDKVVTKDGRDVGELHLFTDNTTKYPLMCTIEGETNSYTVTGCYYATDGHSSPSDLFMAYPKKQVSRWKNTYWENNELTLGVQTFSSELEAKECAGRNCFSQVLLK